MPAFPDTTHWWRSGHAPSTSNRYLYLDKNRHLHIEIATDGVSVFPDYKKMAREIQRYPYAMINVSIWDWPNLETSPTMLPHLSLLYNVFNRWISARLDIPLLNYLAKTTGWVDAEHPQVYHFTSLMLRDLGKAGTLSSSLNHFLTTLLCNPYQSVHRIDICGSGYLMPPTKSLETIPFAGLTSIRFMDTRCSAAQARRILESAVGVEEFIATAITGPVPSSKARVATCPNLRVLNIQLDEIDFDHDRYGPVFALLGNIAAPNLAELTLGYENMWNAESMKRFCSICSYGEHHLQKLHLLKMRMDEGQLLYTLTFNFPYLTDLILDGQESDWRGNYPPLLFTQHTCYFYGVNPGPLPGCKVSRLKRLTVRDNCIQESDSAYFGAMVRERFKNGKLDEVVILGMAHGAELGHEDRKALQCLASKGHCVRFQETLEETLI